MSRTLVVGAHGQIGQHFCRLASEAGHPVRAMIRKPEQASVFEGLSDVEVAHGDLEGDFASALDGCDQVVFAAGSGAKTGLDKTLLVDLWGAIRVVDAAVDAGMEQMVVVSSFRTADPLAGPESLAPYLAAKRAADLHLMAMGREKGLKHVILKPGRLTDAEGEGRIRTSLEGEGNEIPRIDVARCALAAVQNPGGRTGEVTLLSGSTPIQDVFAG